MIGRDILASIDVVKVFAPADVTDNTPMVGAIIDMSAYLGGFYAIQSGTLADAGASWTPLLEESDASDLSGSNEVDDVDMLPAGTGQEAAAAYLQTDDGEVHTLGYVGNKRYHRLTVTPAGNASSGPFAIVWVGLKRYRGEVTGA